MKRRDLWAVIWPYFYTYRWPMLVDLVCASLTTLSELVLPLLVRYLANLAAADITQLTIKVIITVSLAFIGLKIVEILAGYYMSKMGHILGAKIETDMRSDIYTHLQTLPDSYYNETKVGQIMARLTNDLFDITEFAHHCPEEYTIGAIKFIIAFFILWRISPTLTLGVYLLIPVMFWASAKYKQGMRNAQMHQRHHIGDLNANIEDSLLGIRVIKSFANEDIELEKFQAENKLFLSIKKDFYTAMAGFNTVNRIFDGLMYLVVIAGGGMLMYQRQIDGADMLAFVLYVQTLLSTVKRVVEFTEQFQKGMTGIERFAEIMETESDLLEAEDAYELKDVKGDICFDQVYFRYRPELDDVLYKFNLNVKAGEKIAIVGPSGSGKTTVSALIPRFYDVTGGKITIDGQDVRDLTLKSLRDHIGIVQQDVYLFSGSVLENIRYGKPDASDEEIIRAAKQANAYDFIMELEDGFNTYVGERGVMLSGGQKQRISIARVFLKNPPILILDEATSALDNESEAIVQRSLEDLSQGRTTITIAHRLTTIQEADRIYVMTQDGIIESGSHEALMAKQGYYHKLYTRDL